MKKICFMVVKHEFTSDRNYPSLLYNETNKNPKWVLGSQQQFSVWYLHSLLVYDAQLYNTKYRTDDSNDSSRNQHPVVEPEPGKIKRHFGSKIFRD
jgi:hypothetical protein